MTRRRAYLAGDGSVYRVKEVAGGWAVTHEPTPFHPWEVTVVILPSKEAAHAYAARQCEMGGAA